MQMAGATGLEPATSCVTGSRSNQLNYAPALEPNSLQFLRVPFRARRYPKIPENAVTASNSLVTD